MKKNQGGGGRFGRHSRMHVIGAGFFAGLACVSAPAAAQSFQESGNLVCAEAESGSMPAGTWWQTVNDAGASNERFIVINSAYNEWVPTPSGSQPQRIVRYPFTLTGGSYRLHARLNGADGFSDSFFFRIDGGPWRLWAANTGGAWQWRQWTQNGNVDFQNLAAGEHVLEITYRERNTKLDKFVLQKANLPAPTGFGPAQSSQQSFTSLQAASRFLHQAGMGPTYEEIAALAAEIDAVGETAALEAWLDAQIATPHTTIKSQFEAHWGVSWTESRSGGMNCSIFTTMVQAPDQLRQRLNNALSQILVVGSPTNVGGSSGFLYYWDTLGKNALGNYRDLLYEITLNPAMGRYLSHLGNAKANPTLGSNPDENYAREVMQLFSIGLFELNNDGTRKKDAAGRDIPTYTNEQITEFAEVFTGLSWSNGAWAFAGQFGNSYALLRMYDQHHDQSSKKLLNGVVLPAFADAPGRTGMDDINDGIDNIFEHPNVGPFIGRLLIQQLVKSNPSPAYINRVATAFNGGNGTPRGDMAATVKAILLDPEARQANRLDDPTHGKLVDPYLRMVQLARAYDATITNDENFLRSYELYRFVGSEPLRSPSVFNFYLPDHQPAGPILEANLVGPEFQIYTDVWAISIANSIKTSIEYDWPFWDNIDLNYDALYGVLAAEGDAGLVERINLLSCRGLMSDVLRSEILHEISDLGTAEQKVQLALYLALISAESAILR